MLFAVAWAFAGIAVAVTVTVPRCLRKPFVAGYRATKRLQFARTVFDEVTRRGEMFVDWVLQRPNGDR